MQKDDNWRKLDKKVKKLRDKLKMNISRKKMMLLTWLVRLEM